MALGPTVAPGSAHAPRPKTSSRSRGAETASDRMEPGWGVTGSARAVGPSQVRASLGAHLRQTSLVSNAPGGAESRLARLELGRQEAGLWARRDRRYLGRDLGEERAVLPGGRVGRVGLDGGL